MAAAIPVSMEVEGNDEIEGRLIGGGQALQIDYYGPYDGVGPAHYALEDYSNENGVNLEGFAMEVYVTDPMEEADTSKWLTRIIYPIAAE
jgi:effector-binding domain-containing protein